MGTCSLDWKSTFSEVLLRFKVYAVYPCVGRLGVARGPAFHERDKVAIRSRGSDNVCTYVISWFSERKCRSEVMGVGNSYAWCVP